MDRVDPNLRRFAEVLPPAALAIAACGLVLDTWRGAFDAALVQFTLLLALYELVSITVESLMALWRTQDPRLPRAIGFVAGTAAVVASSAGMARAWPESSMTALASAIVLVAIRFAMRVADPARDELARLRATALANDRLESLRIALGVVPFLAFPGFAMAYAGWIDSLRPVGIGVYLLVVAWALMLAAAAWHIGSRRFARRPVRLFVRGAWPRLGEWYEPPHARQRSRRDREAELREARTFARRVAASERDARRLEPPTRLR